MFITLVVGLGNPGRDYTATRHNAGWRVLDALAAQASVAWRNESAFEVELARWSPAPGRTLLLAKPQTYMNDSGRAVAALASYFKLCPAAIAVAHDDLAIPFGRVKISERGSAGGHNGIASLLQYLGDGFVRYRIGIGPKSPPQMDQKDFVLGKFNPEEAELFQQNISTYLSGLRLLIDQGPAPAMNLLNRSATP
jgi:peptidyl-tRNA hydrolase, PTH1 family